MFCSNCGKEIPENTKFCNHCGAQQTENNASKPTESASEKPKKNSKKPADKKTKIIITVVVLICAAIFGRFVMAPSMTSEPTTKTNNIQSQLPTGNSGNSENNNSTPSVNTSNSAYDAVFDGTYIVHFQPLFNMDTASFATKFDNGIIYCSDYGYKDDVVVELVETMYVPVSDYSDSEKTDLENSMRADYAVLDTISCCKVTYTMGTNYLTVKMAYSDLDKPENYTALYNANIIGANTFISMSETEKQMLNEGAVKK